MSVQEFYSVTRGRKPGVYSSWSECKEHVVGVEGSYFEIFSSEPQAYQHFCKAALSPSSSTSAPKTPERKKKSASSSSIAPGAPKKAPRKKEYFKGEKFYAVAAGDNPGVYNTHAEMVAAIGQATYKRFKCFPSVAECEAWIEAESPRRAYTHWYVVQGGGASFIKKNLSSSEIRTLKEDGAKIVTCWSKTEAEAVCAPKERVTIFLYPIFYSTTKTLGCRVGIVREDGTVSGWMKGYDVETDFEAQIACLDEYPNSGVKITVFGVGNLGMYVASLNRRQDLEDNFDFHQLNLE
jgi:viroplasmin and RNaseH domain-containing protein